MAILALHSIEGVVIMGEARFDGDFYLITRAALVGVLPGAKARDVQVSFAPVAVLAADPWTVELKIAARAICAAYVPASAVIDAWRSATSPIIKAIGNGGNGNSR